MVLTAKLGKKIRTIKILRTIQCQNILYLSWIQTNQEKRHWKSVYESVSGGCVWRACLMGVSEEWSSHAKRSYVNRYDIWRKNRFLRHTIHPVEWNTYSLYHIHDMQNFYTSFFFIRKSSFCLSLNFLNFSRNWAWDFLTFFLTFTEINWLEWYTRSLTIFYTWIWIPSLTFWMQ